MSLSIGRRLGPYEITAPVGAGGMGEVYRATDTRLDRTVAIKVLPAALSKDTGALERFRREARAASRATSARSVCLRCTIRCSPRLGRNRLLIPRFLLIILLAACFVAGP